jgi:hypothetical protein
MRYELEELNGGKEKLWNFRFNNEAKLNEPE